MPFDIRRLILALIIAVVVGLILVGLVGPLLITLKVPFLTTIGEFCENWGWVVGFLVGLWFYLTGKV